MPLASGKDMLTPQIYAVSPHIPCSVPHRDGEGEHVAAGDLMANIKSCQWPNNVLLEKGMVHYPCWKQSDKLL